MFESVHAHGKPAPPIPSVSYIFMARLVTSLPLLAYFPLHPKHRGDLETRPVEGTSRVWLFNNP